MRALNNKQGNAYIYLCVLILVISMLLSVLILYMGLCSQVQIQRRDMQAKLEGYVSEFATLNYDSLKQGNAQEAYTDWERFERNAYLAVGFEQDDEVYEYENGNCAVSRPTATLMKGDGFGITMEYTASFPIVWNGKTYADLKVPLTVSSYYKLK